MSANKTLSQQILAAAKRARKKGITVTELTARDLSVTKSDALGTFNIFPPSSSVRARTYELENAGQLVRGGKRNGATIFFAEKYAPGF